MKHKRKRRVQAERVVSDEASAGAEQPRDSVWNAVEADGQVPEPISLDEYMEFLELFLNRLYPRPGFRVTAMTYTKEGIYMKITKDRQTMTEEAEVVGVKSMC